MQPRAAIVAWLLLATLLGHAAASESALLAWSREICATDAVCAAHFGLDDVGADAGYRQQRFDEMTQAWMLARGGSATADVISMCVNGTWPDDQCAGVKWLWLDELQHAKPCGANEQWIVGHGCQCEDGKHCDPAACPSDIDNVWTLAIAVGVACIGVLIMFAWGRRGEEELRQRINSLLAREAAQYMAAQGQIYIDQGKAFGSDVAP